MTKPRSIPGFTVGRVVHFVNGVGTHCAAIITELGDDVTLGECELQVFVPGFGLAIEKNVFFSPDIKAPGTWHWIEPA